MGWKRRELLKKKAQNLVFCGIFKRIMEFGEVFFFFFIVVGAF